MKALTKKQQVLLDRIKDEYYKTGRSLIHVHSYYKESWKKNGSHSGSDLAVLKALAKKGYIKLEHTFDKISGVFNPVADSWGYSATNEDWYAVPTEYVDPGLDTITDITTRFEL